jgi:menaquinone-9 beta-reductase
VEEPRAEVVIVGARVAGAVLASFLGQAGVRVLLVDAGRFPSDTLSTHFFRGGGFGGVLGRVGAYEGILGLGSPPLRREYLFEDGAEHPRTGPPQEPGAIGYNLSVRRITLDAALIEHARRSPSVQFAPETRAVALCREKGVVTGVELVSAAGRQSVAASLVVGADGRTSFVAREVRASALTTESGHRGMYYAYYADFPFPEGGPDGAEFSIAGDEIAYVFPSDGGRTCVALSANLETFRSLQERPEERFEARLQQRHPGIGRRLRVARRDGRLLGVGPTPNFVRRPWGPGWALVGDSEMHQDPFSGQGIDAAGGHAELLAEAILSWRRLEKDWEAAGEEYARLRDALSRAIYDQTVVASRDLSRPPLATAAETRPPDAPY